MSWLTDFTATIHHCLGIDPRTETHDQGGRPMMLSHGKPIGTLVGQDRKGLLSLFRALPLSAI